MNIDTRSTHITPAGGNVFADLGFEKDEAAALQAASKRIIFEAKTRKALAELESGKGQRFASVDDLLDDLHAGD